NVLRMANPNVPVYLLGESMGGAIALDVASEYPALINGLISAVPAAERFNTGRTDFKVFMHLLTGNRKVNVEKSVVDRATADPNLREEWTEDPLGRMNLSAKELMQFQAFMNDNHDRAKKIDRLPVLFVQGGKDKLVKAEGTKELFEKLPTADKNLAMVNGAEHLVYEEGQFSKEVLDLTDNWIKQRLPNKNGQPASPNLMKARAMMQSKQFVRAVPLLQQIVAEEPQNPEPYVLLGLAFLKTGHPIKARENVRQAFVIAHNSKDPAKARAANDLLLNLPPEIIAPALARATQGGLQKRPGVLGGPRGLAAMSGSYKVLIFSAKWCEPCKDLEPIINEAKSRFGKKVEFTVLDVDDESNQPLIEKYHVSPVPTMIFIKPNGEVADYSVGFSGVSGMIKGIAKMLLPG
ncbi:MAG TPA: alpha/beta hydrolase, partial [Candidatus Melainabacteria bacterium]|nr:alpha/beta hydrolase [Candidatus Melainabacteria bacterium]